MDFVGGKAIPNQQLSILRSTDKVYFVFGPMHCIDFRKMALKGSPRLHLAFG